MIHRSGDLDSGADAPEKPSNHPRSGFAKVVLAICAGLVFIVFLCLGTWQVYRLQWKLDLIDRVDKRVHATAQAAPPAVDWPLVTRDTHEYLHVFIDGKYLYDQTARVQASTVLGSGFWLMTPLQTNDGYIVLVNRGFVSGSAASAEAVSDKTKTQESGMVRVTGLLRISETGGGFLRSNDAGSDHWYSRDVAAIAAARHLHNVAPYFIDADAKEKQAVDERLRYSADDPVGGLTVVQFHNNHLVYALTWYGLAFMVAFAVVYIRRWERRKPYQKTLSES